MQTFLPYPNYHNSAACLDNKRCWKQVVEAKQILNALRLKIEGIKSGWQNHPATLMWEGHDTQLCKYGIIFAEESLRRGIKHKQLPILIDLCVSLQGYGDAIPDWMGDDRIHASHRARLLYKNPDWYQQFGWSEKPRSEAEGYFWPVRTSGREIVGQI